MTQEIDIDELLRTLDVALTSDNPMVKNALKKFLFIVKMTEPEANEPIPGPYQTLLDQLESLHRRIERMELTQQQQAPYYPPNTWITTSGGSYTTSSTTAVDPNWKYNPTFYSSQDKYGITADSAAYEYLQKYVEDLEKNDK